MPSRFPSEVDRVTFNHDWGTVSLEFTRDGGLESAFAAVWIPRGKPIWDKETASAFLRSRGVREAAIRNLRKRPNSVWEVGTGKYSVMLLHNDPWYD